MKYLEVGKIVAPHAIKGEVKVLITTSLPDVRFKRGNTLYVLFDKEYKEIKIDTFRMHKGMALISFNGITNINDVLEYVDKTIYVDKEALNALDDDNYYYDDLIGLSAYNEETLIGEVIDVMEVPQGAILVIKNGDKESLVPFVDEFIDSVDLENGKIYINPIEGLL